MIRPHTALPAPVYGLW